MPRTQPDITGKTFNLLKVLHKNADNTWACKCSCGTLKNVKGYRLRSGSTKSCGCLKRRKASDRKLPDGQSAANSVYRSYVESADKRSLPFKIPSELFFDLIAKNCHYCGSEPSNTRKGYSTDLEFNDLDRLDSSKGYVVDNVVPCCFICNRAKSNLPESDFLSWIDRLVSKTTSNPTNLRQDSRTYLIPVAPVSLNQAYSTRIMRKGKKQVPIRYLQPGHRAFKEFVKTKLAEQDVANNYVPLNGQPLAVCFLFLFAKSSFYYKKGTTRRCDVSDFIKLVEDACSEHWKVDDAYNYLVVGHKRWVEDGELEGFIEGAYKDPPHKTLRATIKIVVSPLDENFGKWDGKLVPDVGGLIRAQ